MTCNSPVCYLVATFITSVKSSKFFSEHKPFFRPASVWCLFGVYLAEEPFGVLARRPRVSAFEPVSVNLRGDARV